MIDEIYGASGMTRLASDSAAGKIKVPSSPEKITVPTTPLFRDKVALLVKVLASPCALHNATISLHNIFIRVIMRVY